MKPFLQEVAEDLTAKFGSQLQNCAIVFNNKRPAAYLQKYLANIIQKPFFSPAFYTVQEFFAATTNFKIADFYLQFFTLHQIYNRLLAEEKLAPISSHKFFPLAKIILSDFNQIDADLVNAQKLYQDLEDIAVINQDFDYLSPEQYQFLAQFWTSYSEGKHKKQQELFIKMWRRMPKLYEQFHTALKAQDYVTNGYAYRMLAEGDINEQTFLKTFESGKIIFVGFNALSNAEAKIFTQLQESEKALFYFDVDRYYLDDPLQEAGLFLRKNLQQLGLNNVFQNQPSLMREGKHLVNVFKVQGQSAQAKILNQILAEDYTKTDELGTTAVILADESLLIPTLQTIPTSQNGKEIPLNVTMGYALSTSSIFGLVDLWLNTQLEILRGNSISYKTVEAFITHPLTGLSQKMREKIQTALVKENAVEIGHERLRKQSGLFEVFFQEISQPAAIFEQILKVLDFVLARLSVTKTLKKIDAELFVKTIQELNRLQDTIAKHIENEDLSFIIYLTQKALQSISVPLAGDPLNGLQVMGLLETRNLNFDKVIILGFNEGIIPKSSIGNSFIPDSIRRVYGLPVLENLDAISSYMVYRLLQRAKDINFVYNSLTDDSTSGEPSRILKQLAFESGFNFTYHELNLAIKTLPSKEVKIEKNGNKFIQDALQKYLNKTKTLSPSALTQYIANPLDFFFNCIVGIKEPKEPKAVVEAKEVGSILHKVMEWFYAQMLDQEITAEWIKERQKKVPELVQKAFNFVIYNQPDKEVAYKGMQKVILAIVDAYVGIILEQDSGQAPFRIVSLEQKVSAEISFPVHGTEQSIKIYGVIDRVDVKDGITKIIDYKTGSDKLAFKDIPSLFDTNGKHINKALIQTLLYTHVYEKFANKTFVEPNLYIVKTMNQEGVLFKAGRQNLSGEFLEQVKPDFLIELRKKLTELFEAPYFLSSSVPDNYQYSIYKTLFGK